MASLYTKQDSNVRKTWILMSLFFIIIIGISWFVSFVYGNPLILWIAIIFSIFMNIFSYWYSDKIVIKISGAKELKREDNKELWNIVENLSITAGLPMPKLYIIKDSAPNAFATGRNKEHAVIAVSTGLIGILDRNELEGVIAHELSHIGNKDILLSTIVVVLVGFIVLLSDMFLRVRLFRGRDNDKAGGVIILIGIALMILSPVVASIIQLAISRKREFLADLSGALLTRYPEGLASALEKIEKNSQKMRKANHAMAHLYISNPFGGKGKTKGFVNRLFLTHPPTEERVKALRNFDI